MICNVLLIGCLILAVFCMLAQPAYAYVDPGSGLFAAQLIGTSVAGMIFLLRAKTYTSQGGMISDARLRQKSHLNRQGRQ
jgi:hypothetical protein